MTAQQNLSFALEQILRPIVVNAVEHVLDELKTATPPPAPVADPERFLTKKEVAAFFGVSEVTVWEWEKKGLLTSYRIGNLVRYRFSEVMASPKTIERGGQKQ